MHPALFLLQATASSEQIEQAQKILAVFLPVMAVFILLGVVIVIIPCWFISKKAGFSPWLSLLNLIPLGNLIYLYIMAFSDWKVTPLAQPTWVMQPPYPPPPQPPYPPRTEKVAMMQPRAPGVHAGVRTGPSIAPT